jgi:flagellar hook-associated protein 1
VDSFDIGISGLNASQQAFEIIGNNIANAATEGYHRQRLNLSAAYSSQIGQMIIGGGVDSGSITRLIDTLLDKEVVRQQASLSQLSQQVDILKTIETSFGELSADGGLNQAIDDFFNALQDLSTHPDQAIQQNQVISAAQNLAGQLRNLEDFLTRLENQIKLEAQDTIKQVNDLVGTIAQLNESIQKQEVGGGQSNNLRDRRDLYIIELSKLIGVETQERDYGVVDLTIAGIPVLNGTSAVKLDVGYNEDHCLGITVDGQFEYSTDINGGKLGGLLSLNNGFISDIHNDLNNLTGAIIRLVNQYHVQGTGTEGSFTELTGWAVSTENLSDFVPPLSDGNIYFRVIDKTTGQITRTAVPIDISNDSLSNVAVSISSVTGLNASVLNNQLCIQAEPGYEFDFLPAVLPEPTNSSFNGAGSPPDISVSGIYSGSENQDFTFTVSGNGSVGNGSLELIVTDNDGNTLKTLNIGSGYAAGDELEVGDGIKIALGVGELTDGDSFDVNTFVTTDQTGLLAAAGLNTFFSGKDASDIAICSDILETPGRIATAAGADMTDNTNILRLAGLKDKPSEQLNSMTAGDFYKQLVSNIGSELSTRQTRQESVEAMVQNLLNQQTQISGVDINEEAAQMLLFEQMFKAMSKYLNTVQTSLSTIMELL